MAGIRAIGRLPRRSHHLHCIDRDCVRTSFRWLSSDAKDDVRRNYFGIQMVPQSWQEQLFGKGTHQPDPIDLATAKDELVTKFNLESKEETEQRVTLDLPPLLGDNVEEHFRRIGEQQCTPYLQYANILASSELPPMPQRWRPCPGWVRYSKSTPSGECVPFPDEKALVFDVEVWVEAPGFPLIAVAVSVDAWYAWTSKVLAEAGECTQLLKNDRESLIPLGPAEDDALSRVPWQRLVVGHNVSFDRSYIKDEYDIKSSKIGFLDTLSLHVCVSGFSTDQKGMYKGMKKALTAIEEDLKEVEDGSGPESSSFNPFKSKAGRLFAFSKADYYSSSSHEFAYIPLWMQAGCTNSLQELHDFYCDRPLDKSVREIFLTAKHVKEIQRSFQEAMTYCALDVGATHNVLSKLLPKFFQQASHPCSFAGMLHMASCYLPVDKNWPAYLAKSEQTFNDLHKEMVSGLTQVAEQACQLQDGDRYADDPWLWHLDWSTQKQKGRSVAVTDEIIKTYLPSHRTKAELKEEKEAARRERMKAMIAEKVERQRQREEKKEKRLALKRQQELEVKERKQLAKEAARERRERMQAAATEKAEARKQLARLKAEAKKKKREEREARALEKSRTKELAMKEKRVERKRKRVCLTEEDLSKGVKLSEATVGKRRSKSKKTEVRNREEMLKEDAGVGVKSAETMVVEQQTRSKQAEILDSEASLKEEGIPTKDIRQAREEARKVLLSSEKTAVKRKAQRKKDRTPKKELLDGPCAFSENFLASGKEATCDSQAVIRDKTGSTLLSTGCQETEVVPLPIPNCKGSAQDVPNGLQNGNGMERDGLCVLNSNSHPDTSLRNSQSNINRAASIVLPESAGGVAGEQRNFDENIVSCDPRTDSCSDGTDRAVSCGDIVPRPVQEKATPVSSILSSSLNAHRSTFGGARLPVNVVATSSSLILRMRAFWRMIVSRRQLCSSAMPALTASAGSKARNEYKVTAEQVGLDISFALQPNWKMLSNASKTAVTHPPSPQPTIGSCRKPQHMPGYPNWYRQLCPSSGRPYAKQPVLLTAQNRTAPYLLRMLWDGHPLHHLQKYGWGYLVHEDEVTVGARRDERKREAKEGNTAAPFEEDKGEEVLSPCADKMSVEPPLMTEVSGTKTGYQLFKEAVARAYAKTSNILSKTFLVSQEADGGDAVHPVCDVADKRTVQGTDKQVQKSLTTVDHPVFGKLHFFRLLHKNGTHHNVGNPLAKHYIPKMEDGTLTSASGPTGARILTVNSMISYWRNARQRILGQLVYWNDEDKLPDVIKLKCASSQNNCYGAILPRIIVCGTITRRGVEPCWMTVSNAQSNRVGSELKAMVRTPPGFCFVGADVDSEELWISSLLADAYLAKEHGCTPLGWMVLQGNKKDGTDLHSRTAKTIGITRNEAKVFNYGRIYGAGEVFAKQMLCQFDHQLTWKEATEKAAKLYQATKGIKMVKLLDQGLTLATNLGIEPDSSGRVSSRELQKMFKENANGSAESPRVYGRICTQGVWIGGSESHLFNCLEQMIRKPEARTPVFSVAIPKPLQQRFVGKEFVPSRINWIVQSSGVDYLHALLVAVQWLFDKYKIDGRLVLSIHDEVRFMVKEEDRYRAALALHISNLLVRALFSSRLGIKDLPLSVAFFSQVDIDRCLRKEVDMDCNTPSNPLGLRRGHGLSFGEGVDIHKAIKQTGGCLDSPATTTN